MALRWHRPQSLTPRRAFQPFENPIANERPWGAVALHFPAADDACCLHLPCPALQDVQVHVGGSLAERWRLLPPGQGALLSEMIRRLGELAEVGSDVLDVLLHP
jgi:hypothetical protein